MPIELFLGDNTFSVFCPCIWVLFSQDQDPSLSLHSHSFNVCALDKTRKRVKKSVVIQKTIAAQPYFWFPVQLLAEKEVETCISDLCWGCDHTVDSSDFKGGLLLVHGLRKCSPLCWRRLAGIAGSMVGEHTARLLHFSQLRERMRDGVRLTTQ